MKLFGSWQKQPPPVEAEAFASAQKPAADAASQDSIGKGRKILVIDDNSVVLKAFELKLKASGFQVLTASEGSEAVSVARKSKPDVIVLDINFPPDVGSSGLQWDGFNIMQWMRRFEEVGQIPVIIVSSNEASKSKQKALDAGAADYFQKPVDYEQFMIAVRRLIGQASRPTTTPPPIPG
jgi:two-component system, OmpR family, KDP operon response regulator KdpE